MPVVVNNPQPVNTNNGMGFLLGVILLLVVVFLFFVYGLPYIRSIGGPQVTVPDHINVNVQPQTK